MALAFLYLEYNPPQLPFPASSKVIYPVVEDSRIYFLAPKISVGPFFFSFLSAWSSLEEIILTGIQNEGGDCKTLMFVQISPSSSDLGETLCSLNFASRVRGIESGPARKQSDISELFKYKQMVCILFKLLHNLDNLSNYRNSSFVLYDRQKS